MALIRRQAGLPGIFSDFFENDDFWSSSASMPDNLPAVNIKETDNAFQIDLAAPGVSREDMHIHVDDNVLTISGEHEAENKSGKEDGEYTRREFSYTSFSRSFKLPNMVDAEHIKASCKDGILHLDIPKREEARKKPKREIGIS